METGNNIKQENAGDERDMMRIGIAADHGGFELKYNCWQHLLLLVTMLRILVL